MGDINGFVVRSVPQFLCEAAHDRIAGLRMGGVEAHHCAINDGVTAPFNHNILRALGGFDYMALGGERIEIGKSSVHTHPLYRGENPVTHRSFLTM
ncbi:hypothetical protein HMPREF2996_04150 [Corynebacterium sp. HMSC066C02]|nr:hypothetical protein HMPREF2996_04150 [Corynebacterium sp. HMSC066C02]